MILTRKKHCLKKRNLRARSVDIIAGKEPRDVFCFFEMSAGMKKGSSTTTPSEISPVSHTSETLSETASDIIIPRRREFVKRKESGQRP